VLSQLPLLLPLLLLLSSKAMFWYFIRNSMAFLKQQSTHPMFFGMLTVSLINVTQQFNWVGYGVSEKVVQQKTFVHNTSAVNMARVTN
jgi:hypothetical protein